VLTVTSAIEEESGNDRNHEETQDRTDYSTSPIGKSAAPAVILCGGTAAVAAIVRPIRLDLLAILLAKNAL
jgi:hypothetical protein